MRLHLFLETSRVTGSLAMYRGLNLWGAGTLFWTVACLAWRRGGQVSLTTKGSSGAHRPGSEVLLWAGLGTDKVGRRSGNLFVFDGADTLPTSRQPAGGLPWRKSDVYLRVGEATARTATSLRSRVLPPSS